ncbi:MAG: VWA domain-containing protein, partial [Anaerolineae bacterium]
MSQEADYYAILGVAPSASPEMVRDAFTQILSHFPTGTAELAHDPAYQQVLNAYKVLADPKRRATYDSLMAETFSSPLQISIQASRNRLALSGMAQLIYLLAKIESPEQQLSTRRPLNISLVIDRSTSMRGARMQNVKTAVELILSKLSPDDVISVVSFSDRAEVILPAGKIKNSRALMARIRGIEPSGGTEIFQGLQTSVQEMYRASLNLHTNHIILLTDGHTYGDAVECLNLAKESANQGIGLSAFGIGTEWNDKFLDKLVSPSGGRSGFIETPVEIMPF